MEEEKNNKIKFYRNVLIKAAILFAVVNGIYLVFSMIGVSPEYSIYNTRLVGGRSRLPFGEQPELAYNFSMFNIDTMLNTHEIAKPKCDDEFRVVVLGDSSVWGYLLRTEETITGRLNSRNIIFQDDKNVRFYNLGYPSLGVTKDLMILEKVIEYEPDMIIWMTTLEALPLDKQTSVPLVENNLGLLPSENGQVSSWHTIISDRREISDWARIQLYGVLWAATGIDQYYPETYTKLAVDYDKDDGFHGMYDHLPEGYLALDVLDAGIKAAEGIPVLIVNEPIFISDGENSEVRYNFYYPRWAYDSYREILGNEGKLRGWMYLDLWDVVPPEEFTNTAIHYTVTGSELVADELEEKILNMVNE